MIEGKISAIQKAIREEGLDGWLFWNFRHRDKLSDEILSLDAGVTNSRPWVYAVGAAGEPCKIVNAVEGTMLDALPGTKIVYSGREAFLKALSPLAGKRWGAHLDPALPVISHMDAGTAATLEEAGLRLESAAALIQRLKGLLDGDGIASHERAAEALYGIVEEVWDKVRQAFRSGTPIREGDLRRAMLAGMEKRGVETDHPPIVAAGAHAGDPHYDFSGDGEELRTGDIVQLDLWAKEKSPGAVYADISWVGVYAERPDEQSAKAFADLVSGREAALAFISGELSAGRRPSGAAVDAVVRRVLLAAGYADALRHRTGHGIDTECHGSGANIDSVEFPDGRLLLDGACFSIEPGIYFSDFGLRTEVDVYIQDGAPRISGRERQFHILTC